jgi:predicted thioesterase
MSVEHPDTPRAELAVGLEATVTEEVRWERTIASYDSRLPPVWATPAMIGLMEVAAATAVQPALGPGQITVGTEIHVRHLRAVAVGAQVTAHAKLVHIAERFLTFDVEAKNGEEVVGNGQVMRAVVDYERFSARYGKPAR